MSSYQFYLAQGNLTDDPQMKYVGETPKTTFSIAINKKIGEQERVFYADIECWGKLAEVVANYLRRGRLAMVRGEWQRDDYEDREGNKRHKYFVRADDVRFIGGKDDTEPRQTRRYEEPTKRDDSDLPF